MSDFYSLCLEIKDGDDQDHLIKTAKESLQSQGCQITGVGVQQSAATTNKTIVIYYKKAEIPTVQGREIV